MFYLWMTRRDLTMLIYDNSALESPVPSIQHCHQSDCRAHHRGRERVIPFFSPKVPFKLSQQPQKKKEKRKETDFPQASPFPLCAHPISSQEVACPSHLDLSATGDDDKSCANFHIPRNVRRPVLDRAPSGLVNVAVGWHSPNLATFSESVGMTKARPIALWWCSFCPATAPANDRLSIGLLPEIDHAVSV